MKIIDLDESLVKEKPKIGIYADAGIGKTLLCGSLPGKILLVSAEKGGQKSLKILPKEQRKNISIVDIDTKKPTSTIIEVADVAPKFDWVVLDSVSEISELILAEYKDQFANKMQAYGSTEDDIMDMLRQLIAIDVGFVFIFKEEVIKRQIKSGKDITEIDYFRLYLPGQKLPMKVPHLLDEVFRLVRKLDGTRVLLTENDGRSKAKSRSNLPCEIDVSSADLKPLLEMLDVMGE